MTDDRQWYAKQSAELHAELERRATQLRQYLQALEDARSLRKMTGGVSLDEGDIAITPEAGIEILQQRVGAQQAKLDALEDLARRKRRALGGQHPPMGLGDLFFNPGDPLHPDASEDDEDLLGEEDDT